MIRVGVIGLGMMGNTHLDVYAKRKDVQVVAISDLDPDRLSGKARAAGNIEGQAQGGADLSKARRYPEGMELIADGDVDLVDICLPTPLHVEYAIAALEAGKHVLVEKPLGRTAAEAHKLVSAAKKAKGMIMPAMCMRFWPAWEWLKEAIDEGRYGPVRAAHFRRVANHPGGPFYTDGPACGGALLDLHVHDTDFVKYCFGKPDAVFSRGYSKITDQVDHLVTQYLYDNGPMVSAEGGWVMAPGFGFSMQFTVNFENATVVFDIGQKDQLVLVQDGKREAISVRDGMGYEHEIDYLLNCIASGTPPTVITLEDGAVSLDIVEAEGKSVATGQIVKL